MKVSSRILLSILSALAIVGCTPKTSKSVIQNPPVERSVGATSVYSTAPTTPTIPLYPYTSTPETARDMKTAIEIMYREIVEFESSQGIQYDPTRLHKDVEIAAYVLADTSFGDNDKFVTGLEAKALLKHLQEKYRN